jgi:hypothetical protein
MSLERGSSGIATAVSRGPSISRAATGFPRMPGTPRISPFKVFSVERSSFKPSSRLAPPRFSERFLTARSKNFQPKFNTKESFGVPYRVGLNSAINNVGGRLGRSG